MARIDVTYLPEHFRAVLIDDNQFPMRDGKTVNEAISSLCESHNLNRSNVEIIYHGTVISGTHRIVDLVPAFLAVLEQLDADAAAQIRAEYSDVLDAIDAHNDVLDIELGEEGFYLLDALDRALNDCAPEGYYFGAHPDDGADFGFWPIDDEYDYAYDDDYNW